METELSKKLVIQLCDLQTFSVADSLNSHDEQQQENFHSDSIQLSKSVCSLANEQSRNVNGIERNFSKDKKLVVELCDFMVCSRENCNLPEYKTHRKKVIERNKKRKSEEHSRTKHVKSEVLLSSEDETSDFEEVSNGKRFHVEDNSDKKISYKEESENEMEDSDYEEEEDSDSDWEELSVAKKRKEKEKKRKKEEREKQYEEKKKRKKTENLSHFELQRQNNVDDKLAFLKSLQINEVANELEEAAKLEKARKKRVLKPKEIPDVLRKSKRMENFNIDFSEKAIFKKIDETSLIIKPELPASHLFEDAFFGKENSSLHNFDRYFQNFGVEEEPTTSNFSHDLGRLDPMPNTSYTYHPSRLTCVNFHSAVDRTIILSGTAHGQISLWNINTKPFCFTPHNGLVTHIKVSPKCPTQIVSSSSDGTLRRTDIEKKCFDRIFSEGTACKYFDFISQNEILVARNDGCISYIDCRELRFRFHSKRGFQSYQFKCSDKEIRTVSAHPIKKDLCVALDCSGLIKLIDRRYLKQCVAYTIATDHNVLSAIFSPVNGNSVLCSSKESLCLYDSTHLEETLKRQWKFNILHTSDDFGIKLPKAKKEKYSHLYSSKTTFYTMAHWMPSSDEAFLVSNNFLKKTMILNIQDGHEMSSLKTSGVSTFQAVHPIHNIIAIIKRDGFQMNLYAKDVCS